MHNLRFPPSLLLLVVLTGSSLTGCAFRSGARVPDLSKTTPHQIIAKVARNFSKLKYFDGRAKVIIELPGEGYQGTSRVFINFPDSIYIKTEAILGIDIGALFLNARIFGAYAPRENVLYYGEVETLSLRDFLQIEIETDEFIEVLTGLNQVRADSALTLSWDDNKYLITGKLKQNLAKYWIDPGKYVVTKSELFDENGETILVGEYKRIKTNKGIVLPRTIKITYPRARERFTVYYTRQNVNIDLPAKKFKLKTAKNAKRVYWGDVVKPGNASPRQK